MVVQLNGPAFQWITPTTFVGVLNDNIFIRQIKECEEMSCVILNMNFHG